MGKIYFEVELERYQGTNDFEVTNRLVERAKNLANSPNKPFTNSRFDVDGRVDFVDTMFPYLFYSGNQAFSYFTMYGVIRVAAAYPYPHQVIKEIKLEETNHPLSKTFLTMLSDNILNLILRRNEHQTKNIRPSDPLDMFMLDASRWYFYANTRKTFQEALNLLYQEKTGSPISKELGTKSKKQGFFAEMYAMVSNNPPLTRDFCEPIHDYQVYNLMRVGEICKLLETNSYP